MNKTITAVLALSLTFLLGCATSPVGKWKNADCDRITTEISENGEITISSQLDPNSPASEQIGKWEITDDGKLKVIFDNSNETRPLICDLTIKGDTMTITEPDGDSTRLKRIK